MWTAVAGLFFFPSFYTKWRLKLWQGFPVDSPSVCMTSLHYTIPVHYVFSYKGIYIYQNRAHRFQLSTGIMRGTNLSTPSLSTLNSFFFFVGHFILTTNATIN